MRPVGLVLVLAGVVGLVLGVLAMAGVGFLQPVPSLGDARLPGVGPIIAGLVLVSVGLAVMRRPATP